MKKITVADILNLDVLKNARVVAGKDGLDREVQSVNVCDTPFSDNDDEIAQTTGDIYLSFLYFAVNDETYLQKLYERMTRNRAAALIVFDEYFQSLPADFCALFDQKNIPVIFTDYHTSYSQTISAILASRMHAEFCRSVEDRLNSLIGHRIAQDEKNRIINELNPNFEKNAVVLFALHRSGEKTDATSMFNLCNAVKQNSRAYAAEYRNGLLVILTFSDSRLDEMERSVQAMISLLHQHMPATAIGISDLRPLPTLGTAISQSYTALSSGRAGAGQVVYYKHIGISRVLLDLYDTPALEDFYRDMTKPILDSDSENKSQLFKTMITFAKLDMDYKKTASAMFVHENTVRYRINKIKELIPYGANDVDFRDTISFVYKIYLIKTF